MLLVGIPPMEYLVGRGAGAWIGLYRSGRATYWLYSPVDEISNGRGSCAFFSTFRIGILIFCDSSSGIVKFVLSRA